MSTALQHVIDFFSSFRNVLLTSVVLRISLILYSEWHDAHSVVKYTDVDYRVFSDAAWFVVHPSLDNHAQGIWGRWMNIGDPYTRETYRYTPLLALLLAPNVWLHPSFGKYLFAGCDILAGVLMHELLLTIILPSVTLSVSPPKSNPHSSDQEVDTAQTEDQASRQATLLTALHLLNPLVFSISTRGSSEAVLLLLVLFTLYCALKGRWTTAAVLLGLSTHWKIYPFIYGVACLGVIGSQDKRKDGWRGYLTGILNWRTFGFGMLSAGTFGALGTLMYMIWGYPFLYESYLYHVHRLDHRHNFSPYFYLIYLTYPSLEGEDEFHLPFWRELLRSSMISFVPQMMLSLGTGLIFGRRKEDLAFAWFVQTVLFVVFNKVCTSQYFLWYLLFLPLLIPRLFISSRRSILYMAVWIGTQALWLSEAYKLEFLGQNVFHSLWIRGLIYVTGNCWVLAGIMQGYGKYV